MKQKELKSRVEEALNNIRDYLLEDGGDVHVLKAQPDHSIVLKFLGNCRDCPVSETTKNSIEQTIKNAIPEVKDIKIV